jgi:hypothetical protein
VQTARRTSVAFLPEHLFQRRVVHHLFGEKLLECAEAIMC